MSSSYKRNFFSEEHDLFRDSVRRFIAAEIAPFHADWEKAGVVARSAWRRAGEAGLLACAIPEDYGGGGGDLLHGIVVAEEMARAGATGPAFTLHGEIIAPYILHYGTEEQKRAWLPRLCSGEAIVAIAMTEPSAGSDLQNIRTRAERQGDHYVLNGQKTFISNGATADLVIVACKTDPAARGKGISLILVTGDSPGFRRGRRLEKIGWKAQDTAELFFEDCRVPASNLLGAENQGFYHLMAELTQERLFQAVRNIASAEAAIEWTIAHVTTRDAFGQKLASFQNTQFVLAQLHADVSVMRVFVDDCIRRHMAGALDATNAAIAKLNASELQGRVLDQCLQLFGGSGYMWEMPIARAWADARQGRIAGGTVEMMKQIIARTLLAGR